MSRWAIEVPQELGRSCRSHGRKPRTEIPGDQLQARHLALGGGGRDETSRVLPWYRRGEGNEAPREGRQEVAVP